MNVSRMKNLVSNAPAVLTIAITSLTIADRVHATIDPGCYTDGRGIVFGGPDGTQKVNEDGVACTPFTPEEAAFIIEQQRGEDRENTEIDQDEDQDVDTPTEPDGPVIIN